MKYIKMGVLGLLLLVALSVCGALVLKIFDIILNIGLDNIWHKGFKVGFAAYIVLLCDYLIKRQKENKI